MGYSYGGGVTMLRALSRSSDNTAPTPARAAILVYPDCALADALGDKLAVHQPTLIAMAALDDWTPVSQCKAVLDRIAQGRDLIGNRTSMRARITASTRSACRCAISRASAIAASWWPPRRTLRRQRGGLEGVHR